MPEVTVLIRILNPGDDLPALLDSLSRQTMAPREVLVVDSGSTDGSAQLAESRGARLVHIAPAQFTHARSTNLGFREARGDVVAMLSQDALPRHDRWLEELVAPLADPAVGAVFGRQVARPVCFPIERWEIERSYPVSGRPQVVYSNVNSAARRSVWETRPFDESLSIAEDRVWALSLQEQGHRVEYVPNAEVLHSHTYTLREVYRRCRAEAKARYRAEGTREGLNLILLAWPRQTLADLQRLLGEGEALLAPRAAAYRFCQFAGMLAGGRA